MKPLKERGLKVVCVRHSCLSEKEVQAVGDLDQSFTVTVLNS